MTGSTGVEAGATGESVRIGIGTVFCDGNSTNYIDIPDVATCVGDISGTLVLFSASVGSGISVVTLVTLVNVSTGMAIGFSTKYICCRFILRFVNVRRMIERSKMKSSIVLRCIHNERSIFVINKYF